MGRKRDYQQEFVLLGSNDWVMDKWDVHKAVQKKEQEETKNEASVAELTLALGQQGTETVLLCEWTSSS